MAIDPLIFERNRASTQRIREMAGLSETEMQTRVGEHWTVSIVLAHLAFWDRRVMYVLDRTEQDGKLFIPEVGIEVNDLSLPLWAAIPPQAAARIAIEESAALDARLEGYPPALREEIYAYNKRWIDRALHRNEHLDEAAAALGKRGAAQ